LNPENVLKEKVVR